MLLAEELTFLSRLPEGGELRAPGTIGLGPAVGGALLVDLLASGLVAVEADAVVPVGGEATDPVLASAQRALGKRRRLDVAVGLLTGAAGVRARLVEVGALGHEERRLRPDRWPVLDQARHRECVAAYQRLADGEAALDQRGAALLALGDLCGVRQVLVVPDSPALAVEQVKRVQAAATWSPELAAITGAVRRAGRADGPMHFPDIDL